MLDPLVVQILLGVGFLCMIMVRASAQSNPRTMPTREGAEMKGMTGPRPGKATSIGFFFGILYYSLLVLNIFFYFIISSYMLSLDLAWLSSVIQIAGFGVSLIGSGISLFGYNALGKNWVDASDNRGQIQLSAGHQLVQTGIYSRIRHPIYLGMLYVLGGFALLLLEGVMLLIFPVLVIWVYFRALAEEKVLHEHFGKEYERYMQRTGRFFPVRKRIT
jgi:protein-S-isoprenylcysteine O-methyltransferase Ste14